MRIALVEDNFSQAKMLSEMLMDNLTQTGYDSNQIEIFVSGEGFLSHWHPGDYDIILLDIFMENLSGVDTARKIRKTDREVCLVFCTVSNEFASESYEVNASYYLCKPITNDGIGAMMRRLNPELLEKKQLLVLPDGNKVLLSDVIYTEYSNHVVTVYLKKDQTHKFRASQARMEALLLNREGFFSPIKGIIINFNHVDRKTDENFLLGCGKIVHITRRKSKEAAEAYSRFRFNKMRKEVNA